MTGPLEAGAIDDACCPSVDRTCGHINFFTSAETADEWASDHPPSPASCSRKKH